MMSRLIAALLLLTTAGLTSACTATSDPPTPSNPSTFAETGKFLDMSGYTPANPDDYQRELDNPGRPPPLVTYGFKTSDGVQCSFDQSPLAVCTGNNLPGIPPADCDSMAKTVNTMSTDRGLSKTSDPSCAAGQTDSLPSKELPPFHTLTVFGVTCGSDDAGATACKDPQGRGFVLSPSWSGWLPKV